MIPGTGSVGRTCNHRPRRTLAGIIRPCPAEQDAVLLREQPNLCKTCPAQHAPGRRVVGMHERPHLRCFQFLVSQGQACARQLGRIALAPSCGVERIAQLHTPARIERVLIQAAPSHELAIAPRQDRPRRKAPRRRCHSNTANRRRHSRTEAWQWVKRMAVGSPRKAKNEAASLGRGGRSKRRAVVSTGGLVMVARKSVQAAGSDTLKPYTGSLPDRPTSSQRPSIPDQQEGNSSFPCPVCSVSGSVRRGR